MLNATLRGGTLKDFEVLNKLGEGSFSQVFKVKRLSDAQEYAMKKVKMQLLKDKEKENSLNEVRILASLSDDYIVGYKEAFIDNNELYVIMEYCPKGDIQKLIAGHIKAHTWIEESEIWKAFLHMLKGLKSLHEMKILHRDLKCANVFVSNEGVYKLGDLNVSKIAKKGFVYTQTGTPYYAAPEVWRDEPYDHKCDLWSLGCVIYEMAALKPPFRAMDMEGLYRRIQKGSYDRIPPRYSNELQNLIQMCLKVAPTERPNADQLLTNPLVLRYSGCEESLLQEVSGSSKKKRAMPPQQLLDTIKCPKNLLQLRGKLPKAKYDTNQSVDLRERNISFAHLEEAQQHHQIGGQAPVKRGAVIDGSKVENVISKNDNNKNTDFRIRRNRVLSAGPSRAPRVEAPSVVPVLRVMTPISEEKENRNNDGLQKRNYHYLPQLNKNKSEVQRILQRIDSNIVPAYGGAIEERRGRPASQHNVSRPPRNSYNAALVGGDFDHSPSLKSHDRAAAVVAPPSYANKQAPRYAAAEQKYQAPPPPPPPHPTRNVVQERDIAQNYRNPRVRNYYHNQMQDLYNKYVSGVQQNVYDQRAARELYYQTPSPSSQYRRPYSAKETPNKIQSASEDYNALLASREKRLVGCNVPTAAVPKRYSAHSPAQPALDRHSSEKQRVLYQYQGAAASNVGNSNNYPARRPNYDPANYVINAQAYLYKDNRISGRRY